MWNDKNNLSYFFFGKKMYCTNFDSLCEPHARRDTGGEGGRTLNLCFPLLVT